jgi:hypothetical protein
VSAPYKLNAAQLAVLRWVARGSPPNVMEGHAHRVSAAALRSRGLLMISGRGPTWRATITDAGRVYLRSAFPKRQQTRPCTDTSQRMSANGSTAPLAKSASLPAADPGGPHTAPKPAAPVIAVPAQLRGAHQFVLATREAAAGLTPDMAGRLHVGPRPGVVYMVLSRQLVRRALLVVEGSLREAVKRGWQVIAYTRSGYDDHPGVAIEIRGHCYPIEVHELTETIPFTDAEIAAWRAEWKFDLERRLGQMPPAQRKRKRATGRLRLLLPTGYGGGRAEGPRGPLEGKLASVFRTLEDRATADDTAALESARRAEEQRLQRDAHEARERRTRAENVRAERLLQEVTAWRRSGQIRNYIEALEQQSASLDADERARVAAWCHWARNWADRSDPTLQTSLIAGLVEDDGSR